MYGLKFSILLSLTKGNPKEIYREGFILLT